MQIQKKFWDMLKNIEKTFFLLDIFIFRQWWAKCLCHPKHSEGTPKVSRIGENRKVPWRAMTNLTLSLESTKVSRSEEEELLFP